MRGSLVIARRDMRSAFDTPLAYVLLTTFLVLAALVFAFCLFSFSDLSAAIRAAMLNDPAAASRLSLDGAVVQPLLIWLSVLLMTIAPLLTMRALAEEKRQGTMELLMTAPVEPAAIVLGKFLGVMGIVVVALALTASLPLSLIAVAAPDPGPLLAGYLGLVLVAGAFVSLGLLASALTESAVGAAFLGLCFVLGAALLGVIGNSLDVNAGLILSWMSPLVHFNTLSTGVIDTSDLAFFVLFIGMNLFLTLRVIDSHRWR